MYTYKIYNIITKHYAHIYDHKFSSLDNMDKFLQNTTY